MQNNFYSNGKLLITGEYLVLQGAKALAVPLKFGQSLSFDTKPAYKNAKIFWKSFEGEKQWFEMSASLEDYTLEYSSDRMTANKLLLILKNASKLNPNFIEKDLFYHVSTNMSFKKIWGWGSSSTLIKNVASWANINPYELLKSTFEGSGFDIACASENGPIFYTLANKPVVENADFNPLFKDHLYFLFLGKKQNSNASVKAFKALGKIKQEYIQKISDIGNELPKAKSLQHFQELIKDHEILMSEILNKKRIKEDRFLDFPGEIKSLGAWGGDFVLIASDNTSSEISAYFEKKGLNTLFKFDEIILNKR